MRLSFLLLVVCASGAFAHKACTPARQGECFSSSTFCWDGRVYACANGGFRCEEGAGRCVSKSTYPHLPGKWTRYSCLNNKDFANGAFVKTCAPGTRCGKPFHAGDSPCLRGSYHGDCPFGDGGCIDSTHYCENGVTYKCASGLRCTGYATAPLSGKGNAVSPCAKKLY
ncbi:hypothetical protein ABPG75_008588 [Micractinium tetrahymenae]